ncbi:hypothetical protein [Miltoncostaea oceani]|uniref:DUF1281 family ferredoxin-like fold protein n=1 Tax=Miltoncostaea oceani TaxID=2843216 RepID=UPI001C3DF329|nr:hypothetical protein [Miltoncostaea oceani]
MPNWCQNRLTVIGDGERVAAFREAISGADSPISFARIAPEPEGLLDTIDGTLMDTLAELTGPNPRTGYGWRVQNWGTKWEVRDAIVEDGPVPGHLVILFDTAWSPALPIAVALIEQWPDLEIQMLWAEQSADAGGRIRGFAGDVTSEEEVPDGREREWFIERGWDVWSDPEEGEG